MFSFSLIIFVLLFSVCGINGSILKDKRIVGGVEVSITAAPYTVAILADYNGGGTYSHICGGAIISPTRILTSSQCTNNLPIGFLRIRAGSSFHNSGGQVLQVYSYRQHENYNSIDYKNDIAVINLASSITIGTTALTIALAPQHSTPVDNSVCTLVGWGRLSPGGVVPASLHMVTMQTINQNICVAAFSGINEVTTGMICAGQQGVGGVGSCQGDTGGPLVVGGLLYGIASWGRGCGEPSYPSVFTKTSYYTNWINSN